jgi:hypothetical protein
VTILSAAQTVHGDVHALNTATPAALPDLAAASAKLDAWVESQGFQGWDPHDALNSPLLKALTFNQRALGIAWIQLLKRSPVNLRSVLGVRKGRNPKGIGLFLASYARRYRAQRDPADLQRVREFATWLFEHSTPGYAGPCWGYNFDWANRHFFAPAGTPTLVNTAFNGLALLDCAAIPFGPDGAKLGEQALHAARGACAFILKDLWSERAVPDELALSYTPLDRYCVHNANVLGSALLAAVAKRTGEPELADAALASARFTARRQRPDGSWPYSESRRSTWIDNFHTAYILIALERVREALGTDEFDHALDSGYQFWKSQFFLEDGTPKYYVGETYPVDVHSVAVAIMTFLSRGVRDPEARDQAIRQARLAVERFQDPAGYFHYQIHRHYTIQIPYMRWSQAWVHRAFSELFCG